MDWKYLIISFFIFNNMNLVLASEQSSFKLNYKNLNTITSLVCKSIEINRSHNKIHLNNFKLDKTSFDSNSININYEISGNCNTEYSLSTGKLLALGDEINITAKKSKNILSYSGTIGLLKIDVLFNSNSEPHKLVVTNTFLNERSTHNLNKTVWAESDSTFSFNKERTIAVRKNGKKIAIERDLALIYSNHDKHYNIWSFSSFGCSSKTTIKKEDCEKLLRDS